MSDKKLTHVKKQLRNKHEQSIFCKEKNYTDAEGGVIYSKNIDLFIVSKDARYIFEKECNFTFEKGKLKDLNTKRPLLIAEFSV